MTETPESSFNLIAKKLYNRFSTSDCKQIFVIVFKRSKKLQTDQRNDLKVKKLQLCQILSSQTSRTLFYNHHWTNHCLTIWTKTLFLKFYNFYILTQILGTHIDTDKQWQIINCFNVSNLFHRNYLYVLYFALLYFNNFWKHIFGFKICLNGFKARLHSKT